MSPRLFPTLLLAALIVALIVAASPSTSAGLATEDALDAPSAPHHNVLVIVLDDLGVETLGGYGDDQVPAAPTPTLETLASQGVLFLNAYANPVCSPTRLAMLTGRHGARTGVGISVPWAKRDSANGFFEPLASEVTLPEALGTTHRTAAIGKWHLAIKGGQGGSGQSHPIAFGFERHIGPMNNLGGSSSPPWVYTTFKKQISDAGSSESVFVEDRYATTDQVDDALAVIEEFGDEPWFVWLAFNAPHTPFHVPPAELTTLEVTEASPAPDKFRAAVEAVDTELGRLLDSLSPAVRERTWVVVVGDNGTASEALPEAARREGAKGTVREAGVHVPLIVSGPDVASPGRRVEALVAPTDIFASVCELAGAPVPVEAVDSISFLPHLADPEATWIRRWVYIEKHQPNGLPLGPFTERRQAVRDERYKLIRQSLEPRVQLFDLLDDPHEQTDLLPDLTPEQEAAFQHLDMVMERMGRG